MLVDFILECYREFLVSGDNCNDHGSEPASVLKIQG